MMDAVSATIVGMRAICQKQSSSRIKLIKRLSTVLSLNAACASSAMVPLCNHSKATVVHEEGILRIRHPPPPSGATAAEAAVSDGRKQS
jgi:hypothetical protein